MLLWCASTEGSLHANATRQGGKLLPLCAPGMLLHFNHSMAPTSPPSPAALQRTRSLPDFYPQRNSFVAWLLPRRNTIR